ncbi:hypothetical protein SELMODRAFT_424892 [Selaginella moellendorffii]|uniref:Ribosomal protein L46 N-terminal domain-containing protein n=1 Tax=Selaginella moellendorffii TaxID=88036 RepID=D8SRC3_SELML|nr:uncharacterized protein LOC9640746 [Selaginella moellendorffii]EFJ13025.1 hypothetical protein SELMODRAFT_424892 [Selaginella moellendorffii]|eukprot:XP_002985848.1 uncharacterized protein LOC9640746 [Selaginella moellendorffii]
MLGVARGKSRYRLYSSVAASKPIVAAAVLERLPLYPRPPHPTVASFRELSKKWKQIIGEVDILEQTLDDMKGRAAPAASDQEKVAPVQSTDRKSLQRLLDQRLYLIVRGNSPYKGQKEWHFPEKKYVDEMNLRKCAESALETFLGDLSDVYFAGKAPSGHLDCPEFQRFYYRSHFVASKEVAASKDYAWVSRDELGEYFDETQLELLKRMLPNF